MSRIWITRTQPGADKSVAAFERAGFEAFAAPLLTIAPPAKMPPPPPAHSTLIFTSQNGVRAFCELTDKRSWPVVTVGDATAKLAQSAGFTDVRSAGGTVDDIAELIQSDPVNERLYIHCVGRHVRGDVTGDLRQQGRRARRDVYYASSPVQNLPGVDIRACKAIVFYSPLAAQTYAEFAPNCEHMSAISLSAPIDHALGALLFKRRIIAKAPTELALLKAAEETLR